MIWHAVYIGKFYAENTVTITDLDADVKNNGGNGQSCEHFQVLATLGIILIQMDSLFTVLSWLLVYQNIEDRLKSIKR